jgi:hypothetical protein
MLLHKIYYIKNNNEQIHDPFALQINSEVSKLPGEKDCTLIGLLLTCWDEVKTPTVTRMVIRWLRRHARWRRVT